MSLSAAPRILICRLSALGDCIHTLPLVETLKAKLPGTFIGWICEAGPASLLRGHRSIDEIIEVPKRFFKTPKLLWNLRKRLLDLRFDIALDPQSLLKSALAARLAGASRRIGFAAPHGREGAPWLHTQSVKAKKLHVVERYRELLSALDIDPASDGIRYEIPHRADAEAMIAQCRRQALNDRPYAIINPGAGWASKLWPVDRYAETARLIARRLGLSVIVTWAGEAEQKLAEEIAAKSGCVLAPPTNLPELAALARHAEVMIGSDTGPLHLAVAVGTPCVGIYGPTSPEICGPYGPGHIALHRPTAEPIAARKRSVENGCAMLEITSQEVFEAVTQLCGRAPVGDRNPSAPREHEPISVGCEVASTSNG